MYLRMLQNILGEFNAFEQEQLVCLHAWYLLSCVLILVA